MTGEAIAGRYRLLEPLGRGAMSAVWLAHDDELDRDVAIKMLAPTADRARFEREARAVAALSHPHICSLYDYGEADGRPYMVLEYLPGGTLEDRLADGKPLADADTERYATEIASGLAHAHEHGVVHRDLKPSNVLFDAEDRPKIADFGIARIGGEGTLTEAGTVLGTAAYISPEQAAGYPATAASDVYSFGVMLFRMLTGRLPFLAANAMDLVRMNRDEPPPAVSDVRDDAPAGLAWAADAALVKDPAVRPADGAALLAVLRGEDTAATVVLPAAAPGPRRRSPVFAAVVVLALVLLLGGAALALALSGGGSGDAPPGTTPSMSLPSVPTVPTASTSSTVATTAQATTAASTHATTSTPATTTAHTTTAHTTTAHTTTTAPATTYQPPTTTSGPPATTYDTTTYATTTDTTATATTSAAAPPATTTTATTTAG